MLLLGCLAVPAQMISQALLTHCAVRIFPQTALRPFKSRSKHIYSLLCVQRGFTNKRSCRTCLLDVIVRSEQSILLNMTQRRERQTEEESEGVAATVSVGHPYHCRIHEINGEDPDLCAICLLWTPRQRCITLLVAK